MSKLIDKKILSIGHTGQLNAIVDQTPYGSYAHIYLAVAIRKDSDIGSEEEVSALIEQIEDPSQLLDLAMESAAASHEIRHFHDCFGTIAGATLFINHLSLLREFYKALYGLNKESMDACLPLHNWADSLDTASPMRKFSNRCMRNNHLRDIFNGAFTIEPQPGSENRSYGELKVFGDKVSPAFPLQIQQGDLTHSGFTPNSINTHWVPLGFDNLVEGNAHALQLAVFDSAWRGVPSTALDAAQLVHISLEVERGYSHNDAGPLILPYRISDLLLSKYLRNEHKIESFPRRWLMELTDAALMHGAISEFGPVLGAALPGGLFVGLMEKMEISADRRDIKLPEISRAAIQNFRDEIASCDLPDNIYDPQSPFSTIEFMSRYVRHKIIAPMFDMRLKYGNAVFSDLNLYAEKIKEFPLPPMLVVEGKYRPSANTDGNFPIIWSKYVMLCEVMSQALRNRSVICCPKAYKLVEGLESFELAVAPGCDVFIKEMVCGKWSGVGDQELPKCEFNEISRHLFQWKD